MPQISTTNHLVIHVQNVPRNSYRKRKKFLAKVDSDRHFHFPSIFNMGKENFKLAAVFTKFALFQIYIQIEGITQQIQLT